MHYIVVSILLMILVFYTNDILMIVTVDTVVTYVMIDVNYLGSYEFGCLFS